MGRSQLDVFNNALHYVITVCDEEGVNEITYRHKDKTFRVTVRAVRNDAIN